MLASSNSIPTRMPSVRCDHEPVVATETAMDEIGAVVDVVVRSEQGGVNAGRFHVRTQRGLATFHLCGAECVLYARAVLHRGDSWSIDHGFSRWNMVNCTEYSGVWKHALDRRGRHGARSRHDRARRAGRIVGRDPGRTAGKGSTQRRPAPWSATGAMQKRPESGTGDHQRQRRGHSMQRTLRDRGRAPVVQSAWIRVVTGISPGFDPCGRDRAVRRTR